MKKALFLVSLLLICSGCTTAVIAARDGTDRPKRVFKKAIDFDLQCLAFPFVALSSGSSSEASGDATFALYIAGGIVAYGVVDLALTYPAYSLYRAHEYVLDKYDDLRNR